MSKNFRWLDFKITNRCNNNCVYCGAKNDPPSAKENLSFDTIKTTLEEALIEKFNYFCFLGGEPSIRKDICDIINVIGHIKDVHIRLITNLKIFRKEMYETLFKTESCDAEVVVSFDNFSYPNYKRIIPEVSMKRIEKVNKMAKYYQNLYNNNCKRSVSLHSVISRENFYKIREFVDFYIKKGIEITLGLVCPSIFSDQPKAFNEFKKEEIKRIIDQLDFLEKHGRLNFANNVLRDFLKIYTFGNFSHRLECWGGKKQVIINSDGEVFPCISESYLASSRYGNIKIKNFSSILKGLNEFKCTIPPNSACWDHFLWDRLAQQIESGEDKKSLIQKQYL